MRKTWFTLLAVLVCTALFLTACGGNSGNSGGAAQSGGSGSSGSGNTNANANAGDSGANSSAETIELKWYQPEPDGHPWTDVSKLIAEEIEKNSNGSLKVSVYPAGTLGTQAEAVNMLRAGSLELLTSGPSILASFHEPVQVFSLPYIFNDVEHAYRVFESDYGQKMFNEIILDKSGVRTLDVWYFGDRNLTTKGIAATKPEDLNGHKIRAMDTPVAKSVVEALGGNPIPINFAELYMSLQTGVVVGQENPVPTILAQKFNEVQDHLILSKHSVHMGTVHVAESIWQKLSEEQRQVVTDALAKYRPEIENRINQQTEEGIEMLKAAGMTVIEPDLDAFRANAQAVIEKTFGDQADWMEAVNEFKALANN